MIAIGVVASLAFVALEPGRWADFLRAGHADAPLDALVGGFFGALIVKHRPRNAVGWLLLLTGTTQGLHLLTNEFATRALVYGQGAAEAGRLSSWLSPPTLIASAGPLVLLLLTFPDGGLQGHLRRALAAFAMLDLALAAIATAALTWRMRGTAVLDGSPTMAALDRDHPLLLATELGIVVAALAAVAICLDEYRRARGVLRQQLKWFGAGFGSVVVLIVCAHLLPEPAGGLVAFASPIPGFIGIYVGIRRHRLYEIDRLVSRGACYLVLTAVVGGSYLVSATLLGWAFGRFSGGGTLAVAASAVLAAGIFNPARHRLQELSDRAFRRRAYDARRVIGRYMDALRVTEPEAGALRAAARAALRDPKAEVALWLPGLRRYVDEAGAPMPGQSVDEAGAIRVDRGAAHLGLILYDAASVGEDQGMVKEVAESAVAAFDHARLRAQVLVQLAEVRASRARILAAGDEQRRRIERDLHDGAQQRLLALALDLIRLEREAARTAPPGLVAALHGLASEVQAATAELRELARGLVPPVLAERGLIAALEALAERAPVPATVNGELAEEPIAPVQSAAYYVVAEALTNVARHASASVARITVGACPEGFVITVEDDGIGGADVEAGTGLLGLRDRVEAAGGTLSIGSGTEGRGTTVQAKFPRR